VSVFLVDLDLVDDDPDNPRGEVGDVSDLKQSLLERGQEDPIHLVRKADGRYLLHEGHRRRKAFKELGWKKAMAVPRRFDSELERLLSQGTMHVHRKNFGPMAWARYCHRLFWQHKQTREDIARQLGVSQAWVRDHISFMTLLDWEQRALERGDMTRADALRRAADHRAERDGKPPAKAKKTASATAKTPRAGGEPHLNGQHQLAEQVAARCASRGVEHAARPKIGGVGCGQCWEDVIRADALTTARSDLALAAA